MAIYECNLDNLGLSYHVSLREAQNVMKDANKNHLTAHDEPFALTDIVKLNLNTQAELLEWLNGRFAHGLGIAPKV